MIKLLQECEIVENETLNKRAKNVTNHEQAISGIKDLRIIKKKGIMKKGILKAVERQG